MPIRVKSRPPPPQRDCSPASVGLRGGPSEWELPAIGPEDTFKDVVLKLSVYATSRLAPCTSYTWLTAIRSLSLQLFCRCDRAT